MLPHQRRILAHVSQGQFGLPMHDPRVRLAYLDEMTWATAKGQVRPSRDGDAPKASSLSYASKLSPEESGGQVISDCAAWSPRR